jgi:hypothetical protein
VELERPAQRFLEAVERDVALSLARARARAVATVDRPVGVEEEGRERQIEVELEADEVEAVCLDDADTGEFLEEGCEFLVFGTRNLRVDAFTGVSEHSPQDDEERLPALLRLRRARRDVVVGPELRVAELLEVLADRGVAVVLSHHRKSHGNSAGEQKPGEEERRSSQHRLDLLGWEGSVIGPFEAPQSITEPSRSAYTLTEAIEGYLESLEKQGKPTRRRSKRRRST